MTKELLTRKMIISYKEDGTERVVKTYNLDEIDAWRGSIEELAAKHPLMIGVCAADKNGITFDNVTSAPDAVWRRYSYIYPGTDKKEAALTIHKIKKMADECPKYMIHCVDCDTVLSRYPSRHSNINSNAETYTGCGNCTNCDCDMCTTKYEIRKNHIRVDTYNDFNEAQDAYIEMVKGEMCYSLALQLIKENNIYILPTELEQLKTSDIKLYCDELASYCGTVIKWETL